MFAPDVSGLIMPVPEVEHLRCTCTNLLRPDERQSIAAHITLLFPFLPRQRLNEPLLAELRDLFRAHPAFTYTLTHVARFPEAIYLAPDPAQPFVALIKDLLAHYPECKPYEGKYTGIIPHLTVAQAQEPAYLDEIEAEVVRLCEHELPLRLQASEAVLVIRQDGQWSQQEVFRLG